MTMKTDTALDYLLVFSNLAILPAILWILARLCKQEKKKHKLIIELGHYTATGVISSIHHLCSDIGNCGYDKFAFLTLDNTLAIQAANVSLIYITDLCFTTKLFVYFIMLGASYISTLSPNKTYFFIGLVGVDLLIIVAKWFLDRDYRKKIDYVDVGACTVMSVIGIVFFTLSQSHSDLYWLYHSLWHIFIFISVYFSLEILNKKQALCCINKRNQEDCPV